MAKNNEEKQHFLEKLIDTLVKAHPEDLKAYIDKFREQNNGISDDDLARKVVRRKAFKIGLVGAATGLGGLITLPVAVPADLAASWRIQATMVFAIAYIYGHTAETTDLKTDIYIILAGNAAKEALRRVGIETAKGITKKMVGKYITREMMKRMWKVVGQKIITKAGQKSLTSFVKMVPIVGAPVGFVFNWIYARIVGNFAIKYYSGRA